jgi:hypothetical protein
MKFSKHIIQHEEEKDRFYMYKILLCITSRYVCWEKVLCNGASRKPENGASCF